MRIFTQLLNRSKHFLNGVVLSVGFLPAVVSVNVGAAQISGVSMADYTAGPVTSVESVTPQVMLTMGRDHQYWFKAYNDFSDIDADGAAETTYDDTFTYYGYFHSELCYTYDDSDDRFEPVGDTDGTVNKHYCSGTLSKAWSGNFLNWATMTRMDVVRKILYGGKRSTDTGSLTVLERAHLPPDAHSFTKYYNGADLALLTPFDSVETDTTNGGNNDGIDDSDEGITMCNTTFQSAGNTQTSTTPPFLRVIKNNRQLWNANERWQCTWEGERGDNVNGNDPAVSGINSINSDPPDNLRLLTLNNNDIERYVRVVACDPSFFTSSNNLENCEKYPSGNLKPTGLLQRYGATGQINFGLITGSWQKNISGGVLRKNVGGMDDEINNTTDGTFKAAPGTGAIIDTLNRFRMYGLRYVDNIYFGSGSGDNCLFQLAGITEGTCNAWGNPISEIYLEALRYFAIGTGAPTPAFNANDSGFISGLTTASWATDPLNADNACASVNVIAFNASVNSYDDNATSSPILGGNTPRALTNVIGVDEGIAAPKKFFIGKSGAATDEFCGLKTITELGDSFGLCPEGPTVQGSYHMSGMAHYAHTNDLRTDLEGDQNVTTFAVALATTLPVIEAPVGPDDGTTTQQVTILPAYRLVYVNGGGALVDFKIVRGHTEVDPTDIDFTGVPNDTGAAGFNPAHGRVTQLFPDPQPGSGVFHGKYYINWEDSEQGGDYDQDVWGTLDYVVDTRPATPTITVTTLAVAHATGNGQLFGFITGGTTQDGFHAYSGVLNGNYTDPTGVKGCVNCRELFSAFTNPPTPFVGGQQGPQSYTFTTDASVAGGLLESPLYYAAKWGGFSDGDGDDTPNLREEWDVRDGSGQFTPDGDGDGIPDGDGVPDNFFFVSNPAALEDALTAVFDIIIERVSSGTAAAVVANDQEGVGAVFQALYDPFKSDSTAAQNEAQWIGTLHALWVDPEGLIREDNDQDAKLDGYDVDKVVEIFFDDVDRRAKIKRFDSSDPNEFIMSNPNPTPLELTELKTIWNARERLSDLDNDTMDVQRTFVTPVGPGANEGRHILTWVDDDFNDIVNVAGSEMVNFDTTAFSSNNRHRWLDEDDVAVANNLINWVRGKEITGLRNRIVDYDGDNAGGTAKHASGNLEIMRLGDIIHSTPIPVSTPIEAYDLLALDISYGVFRAKYVNRRQVAYIGGNDGMIHAINAGFFDASAQQFKLSLTGQVQHPLGAEIWAYIPKNLLPHLQWMARPDYSHVFYMDQTPRVFDAKIFTPDTTHPFGWGTVLVAGMRFGGGSDATSISLDIDGDATADATMKSALVILDITDPEQPPEVLAELSPDTLNFTTSFPQVAIIGDPIEPGSASTVSNPNKWYLVFGSGPTSLGSADSTQKGRLFAYDLQDLASGRASLITLDGARVTTGPFSDGAGFAEVNENNTFIGDPVVVDLDVDMKTEALYFGTVGDADADDGSIWRIAIGEEPDPNNWGSPFRLLNPNQPFIAQPSVTVDQTFQTWVLASTGRLYVNADKSSTGVQTLYGFIDKNPATGDNSSTLKPTIADLIDTSKTQVFVNGDVNLDGTGTSDTAFDALVGTVDTAGGWKRDYRTFSPDPSERSLNRSTLIDGVLFNTAFTPSTDLCTAEGSSILLAVAFNTGTAIPSPILGEECPTCPVESNESSPFIELGAGLASTPSIHIGNQDIPGKVTVITQKSTGEIETTDATTLGGIANGEISWREYRTF